MGLRLCAGAGWQSLFLDSLARGLHIDMSDCGTPFKGVFLFLVTVVLKVWGMDSSVRGLATDFVSISHDGDVVARRPSSKEGSLRRRTLLSTSLAGATLLGAGAFAGAGGPDGGQVLAVGSAASEGCVPDEEVKLVINGRAVRLNGEPCSDDVSVSVYAYRHPPARFPQDRVSTGARQASLPECGPWQADAHKGEAPPELTGNTFGPRGDLLDYRHGDSGECPDPTTTTTVPPETTTTVATTVPESTTTVPPTTAPPVVTTTPAPPEEPDPTTTTTAAPPTTARPRPPVTPAPPPATAPALTK